MKKTIASLCFIIPSMCSSLLPPLYESVAEFKSLINDEQLVKSLDSAEFITDIKKEKNFFLITTNTREIRVEVVYTKNQLMGPAVFHLTFPKN